MTSSHHLGAKPQAAQLSQQTVLDARKLSEVCSVSVVDVYHPSHNISDIRRRKGLKAEVLKNKTTLPLSSSPETVRSLSPIFNPELRNLFPPEGNEGDVMEATGFHVQRHLKKERNANSSSGLTNETGVVKNSEEKILALNWVESGD